MGRPRKYPLTEEQIAVLRDTKNDKQIEMKSISENETTENNTILPIKKEGETVIFKNTPSECSTEAILNVSSLELKDKEQSSTFSKITTEINNALENIKISKNIPPIVRKRNEYGFLENVDYVFKENGKVDWRKMIKPEYLVFNKEKTNEIEKKYGKKLEELSVTEVDDKYLLILLFGIRNLAALRGFESVIPKVDFCSDFKATVTTLIDWIPNNDTCGEREAYGDIASASAENTNGFGKMFLETIAANRAFVRAVRNYLEINIVGFDEVKNDGPIQISNDTSPINVFTMLERAAKDLNLTFEQFKEGVKTKYSSSIDPKTDFCKWSKFNDLSPNDAYKMLNILKEAAKVKKI